MREKNIKEGLITLTFLVCFAFVVEGQSSHDLLMEGDDLYKKEQYDLAEGKYRKAKVKDKSGKAAYNLGNSLSVQERYEEAANQYSNAAAMSDNPEVKSKAFYNLGNTHFRNQKFQESVDAYKSALTYNEEDTNAKENLMMAKRMLQIQEQQEQQEQQQQDQEQQENQEQQEQEQQENQEQQESESQSDEEQEQPQAGEESEKKDLDKEDARKLLEIIDNEEKKVQEKLRKMKGNSKKPKKDW